MFASSPLHDTYYVVPHGTYVLIYVALAFTGWIIWRAIRRLHPARSRWQPRLAASSFGFGAILTLLPLLPAGGDIGASLSFFWLANVAASLGAILIVLAIVVTAAGLIAAAFAAMKRRD